MLDAGHERYAVANCKIAFNAVPLDGSSAFSFILYPSSPRPIHVVFVISGQYFVRIAADDVESGLMVAF